MFLRIATVSPSFGIVLEFQAEFYEPRRESQIDFGMRSALFDVHQALGRPSRRAQSGVELVLTYFGF